jgi:uncharacterized tellurite resistance protein B-like protein
MLEKIKDFFSNKISVEQSAGPVDIQRNLRVATCALLIEMASIDDEFETAERDRIINLFQDEYGLSDGDIKRIFDLARQELDTRVDLWGFTNLINQYFDKDQKIKVIEMVWEVVYADGKLSAHEDYLVHKLYKMLDLSHSEMIDAKMRVLERTKH